jgi:predicted transposase YbfD/YdcC
MRGAMASPSAANLTQHFSNLRDPRIERTKEHLLLDIVVIAICALLAGADGWVAVEAFGHAKEKWLRTFLTLPNGIPSHDTFGRVFAALDPVEFQHSFLSWVQAVSVKLQGEIVAVDGKTLRRSHDKGSGKKAIHMVSAWATAQHLVMGQRKIDAKSNEITAIPELLKVLALEGCIVTVDALGCQTEIAETIVNQGAEYVLAVKENQGKLQEDLKDLFDGAAEVQFREVPHAYERQVTKDHGRVEIRECWVITDDEYLDFVRRHDAWKNLGSLIRLHTEVRRRRKRSTETRYFISSLQPTPQEMLHAIRGHWGIENGLHWILDVTFREDDSRVRKDHAAENFAVLRHIAVNLLTRARNGKDSIKTMRLRAGWDETFLAQLISQ